MARRRQSTFEDLIDVAAMFPWWVGVVLALVSYPGLHAVATMPNTVPADLKGMGQFAGRQLWITLASIFQWALPAAFLIGAAISGFKGARRRRLHAEVAQAPSRGALESMSWREFELLVSEMFRRKGFVVTERGGEGADGGVDLELRSGDDKYFVQCKQWKSRKVGVTVVRELYGVMAAEGAVGGFVVASGEFTEDARQFAEGRAIELVATDELLHLIGTTARGSGAGTATAYRADPVAATIPQCPLCAAEMVLRTARKGANSGQQFWGCRRYPACRGTRSA
jgi:restriction system protein